MYNVEVDVGRITILLPFPPSLFFLSLPTVQLFQTSARLKLVSVSFSSLLLDIDHLEKSFQESIM